MSKPETIMIDEVKYVRADSITEKAPEVDGMQYCIIRSYGAGVFAAYVKEQKSEINGVNVIVVNARRLHSWSGACSLSQLALEGTKNPSSCNFSVIVPEQFIANVVEIIPISKEGMQSIDAVEVWKK